MELAELWFFRLHTTGVICWSGERPSADQEKCCSSVLFYSLICYVLPSILSLFLYFSFLTRLLVTTLSVCDFPVRYARFTTTTDGTELICSESGEWELVALFPVRIFTYTSSNIRNRNSFYLSPYWEPILEMVASTLCRATCRVLQNVVLSQS